ncbi:MAG TPA: DUF6249 domain-containing protein [Blastocatellia bacterium]|nr:DUF6249 domain-containing protein [Blastocatellia bacterium]
MFCPLCGISQPEDLKFCKSCGANLHAVRQVVTSRETGEKFDWSKTWLSEMLLSQDEQKKRKRERERSTHPAERRYNEIKAGIITSCAGVGVMIFLYFLMQGIILSGHNPPGDAEILGRIWIAGVIPFFVGVGLLISGLFVNRRLFESTKSQIEANEAPTELASGAKDDLSVSSDNWPESGSPQPSVTENTTRQLRDSGQRQ